MGNSQNSSLALYAGDTLAGSRQWSNLDPGERKRRAAEACAARDIPALWHLTQSYWTLFGASGAHVSPNSIAAYKRGVTVFITDTARSGHSIMRFPRDAAAVWVRTQEQAGLSTSTIQVRLAAARMLYKALRWCNVVDTDPLADIKPARDPTPPHEKRAAYADSDVERLLIVCTTTTDRLLVLLCAHSGLRISEALALQYSDIDLEARTLTVLHGKGGKRRTCPLSRRLSEALSQICDTSGPILPYRTRQTAAQHMRRLCDRAGVKYRALHSLRHTAGVRLYRETGKLELAQELLGHSNIATTQRYTGFASDALEQSVGNW